MAKEPPLTVDKAPCKSCPYRKDVPSGVWAANEYAKLPKYDGSMVEQIQNGGTARFDCHQRNGKLCAGWVGCHGVYNLIALRLTRRVIADEVFDFKSPVPLFASGAEAAAHGMKQIAKPRVEAKRVISRLLKKRALKGVLKHG